MNLIIAGALLDSLRDDLLTLTQPTNSVLVKPNLICLRNVSALNAVRYAVDRLCTSARVDHAFVEPTTSLGSFKLLAIDMDSTLITIECIDELAEYAGKKKEVAEITEAAMRGEITDFYESLRRRLAYLAGVNVSALQRVYEERLRLTSGAEELIKAAHHSGLKTVLVSGGFTYFADRLARELGLTAAYANELEVINETLTGKIIGQMIGPLEKALIVSQVLAQHNFGRDEAIVIGDGSNDIAMMNIVDVSFAFHAKPLVNAAARYSIRFGPLTTVLDFFGAGE